MIKTIKTLFSSEGGDMSPMYVNVASRTVVYPNENKIMNIQYKYFIIIDNMEIEQSYGSISLPYSMIQSFVDGIIKAGIIKDEGKSNDEILDKAIPYLLIEYQKSNIDENGKTPFAIPTNDWEVYAKPVVEEIVEETLPVIE